MVGGIGNDPSLVGYQKNSNANVLKAGVLGAGAYGAYTIAKDPAIKAAASTLKSNAHIVADTFKSSKGLGKVTQSLPKITDTIKDALNIAKKTDGGGVIGKAVSALKTKGGILTKLKALPLPVKILGAAAGAFVALKGVLGNKQQTQQPNPFGAQDPMMANLGINTKNPLSM